MITKYEEGQRAYRDGKSHYENPYHPDTSQSEDWYDGWQDALYEEESGTNGSH